jgi:hypothetical protein
MRYVELFLLSLVLAAIVCLTVKALFSDRVTQAFFYGYYIALHNDFTKWVYGRLRRGQ